MKHICAAIIIAILLSGCGAQEDHLQRGLRLREMLLTRSCSFVAEITADYGKITHTFRVGSTVDANGNLSFVVIAPESISGVTGNIKANSGYLTFDNEVLAFPLIADGEVSPVSAPWLLIKTLRSGYLMEAGMDGELLQLVLNDSYEEDALRVDVWLNAEDVPISADIQRRGRRVLSIIIENFAFV